MEDVGSMDEGPMGSQSLGNKAARKRRSSSSTGPSRRSTNACRRCKSKKIKCHYNSASIRSTCNPCAKAGAECVFDVAPDGIPRGAEYIAALETRITTLEAELHAASSRPSPTNTLSEQPNPCHYVNLNNANAESDTSQTTGPGDDGTLVFNELHNEPSPAQLINHSRQAATASLHAQYSYGFESRSNITIFNLLQSGPSPSNLAPGGLPSLPSPKVASHLVETVYLYTQARHCIVDWVQVRHWHMQRGRICLSGPDDDVQGQIGAYFLWMIYAIGAQFVPNAEHTPEGYYARAFPYLEVVLAQQNLQTLQAFLTMIQFNFRAKGVPSIWDVVGVSVRLCLELGYHRKSSKLSNYANLDPYTIELQKRFFWCVYSFDRMVSIMTKRPFGIHDLDIDVELPVDVDVTCTDQETIRNLQIQQAEGIIGPEGVTTMSASLHHLAIYRLRSRILTRFTGPHSLSPGFADIMQFLAELDEWRQMAPRKQSPSVFPQQSDEDIEATYFQACILLIRPILIQTTINDNLLYQCASLAADACENAKVLSLSPYTHNSPISGYNCFRCGITLLQCLAVQPRVLPLRRSMRAISSCSSALAVYTRALDSAAPYLQLFDKLSDHFLGNSDETGDCTPDLDNLRTTLQRITFSAPWESPEILRALSVEEAQQGAQASMLATLGPGNPENQYDFLLGSDTLSTLGVDLIMPFEVQREVQVPFTDTLQQEMTFPGGKTS